MKLFILMLCFATLSALGQEAVSTERIKLAEQIISLNGTIHNLKKVSESRISYYGKLMERRLALLPDRSLAEKTEQKLKKMIEEEMQWKTLFAASVKVYASHFSESELKEILAFYHSPIGKKMLTKNQDIDKDLSVLFNQTKESIDHKAREILKSLQETVQKSNAKK